jgi:Putative DNA-binding domain
MDLFDFYRRLDEREINRFITSAQEENLHLDFKAVNDANIRNKDDRRNLAKCLSGFSNSDGGIIVWGIDARKNAQGINGASTRKEITPIKLFVSRLNELTGQAISPTFEGIVHKAIEVGDDSGFAATLVPESDSGPHMAKLGEDRYYKRSGDSFYRMEHFDLEDMFGRRQKPRLAIILDNRPSGADNYTLDLHFSFKNSGRALAKHTGSIARITNAELQMVGGRIQNVTHLNGGLPTVCHNDDVGVVHPTGIPTHVGFLRLRRLDPAERILMDVTFFCDQARSEKLNVEIPIAPNLLVGWKVDKEWSQEHGAIFVYPNSTV